MGSVFCRVLRFSSIVHEGVEKNYWLWTQ